MNHSEQSIRADLDPTNTGQYFASCGPLEHADRASVDTTPNNSIETNGFRSRPFRIIQS
jgi:hypothetical protein